MTQTNKQIGAVYSIVRKTTTKKKKKKKKMVGKRQNFFKC